MISSSSSSILSNRIKFGWWDNYANNNDSEADGDRGSSTWGEAWWCSSRRTRTESPTLSAWCSAAWSGPAHNYIWQFADTDACDADADVGDADAGDASAGADSAAVDYAEEVNVNVFTSRIRSRSGQAPFVFFYPFSKIFKIATQYFFSFFSFSFLPFSKIFKIAT